MSKYTTQIRFICESLAGRTESAGYDDINEIIELARPKIFSFDYPIFDEAYKKDIETKILKHYYTREICAETLGRWKLFLESRLIEIMPYYNELYKTTLLDFDILEDVNYSRTGTREDNGTVDHTGTDSQNVDSTSWNKFSDTPQGTINDLNSDSYMTNATKQTLEEQSSGENAYTDTRSTLEEYGEIIKGKYPGKSYTNLITEFRDALLDIDKMIINDLADLFFNIY